MFQNLLRDTCLELCEYGGAMEMMIAEVEAVIGGVGGEGIQKAERDMTRDVLERIDGLHSEKRLTLPKLSRVLIEERVVVRGIPRGSGKTWFVVFNDVVLRCQQTGTTSLPGWGTYGLRINPTPEIPGAAALVTPKRGKSMAKQRNLYKFLKVRYIVFVTFGASVDGLPRLRRGTLMTFLNAFLHQSLTTPVRTFLQRTSTLLYFRCIC